MFPNLDSGDADDLIDEGPQLIAQVSTTEDGRDQCTIHPESATDQEVTTRWITAEEDSFVELETAY